MISKKPSSIKAKYHHKVVSDSAICNTYLRLLDIEPLFARYVWMQLSVFDLSELGLGLLYNILPVDFEPYSIDYAFETPTVDETLQGIWAKFKKVDFSKLYAWMTDFREYIMENFEEEYQASLLAMTAEKAVYGITPYARGVYDPVIAREFLRATFHKLRLLRTPDESWKSMLQHIADYLEMIGVTDDNVFNRIMMLFSAQTQSFVLGLGVLGLSRLPEMDGEYSKVPFMDAQDRIHDLKFRTLDHLQLGFILGVTPLGYGLLLPKNSIYKLKEGKKNPPVIEVLTNKISGIINRLTLSTWAYSNYNRPEEMLNYHKSDKADQYDLLQTQRRFIENWVHARIPPDEANPVRIRQYQNAVLQCVCWRAKRHRWGFKSWESMTEDQFKEWWLDYWTRQGLSRETLNDLYGGMSLWVERARENKLVLGRKVQQIRKRLALSV
ncbi:MAG: hypothetical protein DRP01_02255 [Archaeoglobales archaeon]|nr:MAG: hypothetical protein DRP01_02255 [Archaeoglobales archaeon]